MLFIAERSFVLRFVCKNNFNNYIYINLDKEENICETSYMIRNIIIKENHNLKSCLGRFPNDFFVSGLLSYIVKPRPYTERGFATIKLIKTLCQPSQAR